MKKSDEKEIGAILKDGRLIDEAIAAAHAEVLRRHRQAGVPIVIWRHGQVVEMSADEFEQMADKSTTCPPGSAPASATTGRSTLRPRPARSRESCRCNDLMTLSAIHPGTLPAAQANDALSWYAVPKAFLLGSTSLGSSVAHLYRYRSKHDEHDACRRTADGVRMDPRCESPRDHERAPATTRGPADRRRSVAPSGVELGW